jgi:hypothetical protein
MSGSAQGQGHPTMPPITDDAGIVDWFLRHDDAISDLRRNFPSRVEEARREFIADLKRNGSTGPLLKAQLAKVSKFYSEVVLPGAAERQQRGGPILGETRQEYLDVMFLEAALAAKMRIFGYILVNRYGIQPE